MIGPKSLTSALQDLRPKDNTMASIAMSLNQLAALKSSDVAEIARIEKSRPAMLLSASPADIDQADQTVRHLRIRGEQLAAMKPELERLLGEARIREEDEEYRATLANLTRRVADWNKRFREEYPAWRIAIQPLFDAEKALEGEINEMTKLPGARRANPNVSDNAFYALQAMLRHGGGMYCIGRRYGELAAQLPSIPDTTS